jgi:hypothetical protein
VNCLKFVEFDSLFYNEKKGGRDRMAVGLQLPVQSVLITTNSCEFEPRSWRSVLDTTLWGVKHHNPKPQTLMKQLILNIYFRKINIYMCNIKKINVKFKC